MFVSYSAGQSGGLGFRARQAKSNLYSIIPSFLERGGFGQDGRYCDSASSRVIRQRPPQLELSLVESGLERTRRGSSEPSVLLCKDCLSVQIWYTRRALT